MAEGYVMKPGESLLAPSQIIATDGYVEALQVAVTQGRAFESRDGAEATRVAMVDERLARKFWPDQDPIGRRLYRPSDPNDFTKITPETVFFTVVGVVSDLLVADPRVDANPVGTFYFPASQTAPGGLTFTIRTAQADAPIGGDIRRAISAIDPGLSIFRLQPMQAWIDRALIGRRAPMLLAAGFGVVALFLASLGIYGVLAYGVSERSRELGVRMALGGSSGSVFRLVLIDGVTIVGVGMHDQSKLLDGLHGLRVLNSERRGDSREAAPCGTPNTGRSAEAQTRFHRAPEREGVGVLHRTFRQIPARLDDLRDLLLVEPGQRPLTGTLSLFCPCGDLTARNSAITS